MKLSAMFKGERNSYFNRCVKRGRLNSKRLARELKRNLKALHDYRCYQELRFEDLSDKTFRVTDCYGNEILRAPATSHLVLVQRLVKKEGYKIAEKTGNRLITLQNWFWRPEWDASTF